MAQGTLIFGLTVEEEHLNAIGLWASRFVGERSSGVLPIGVRGVIRALRNASRREQDQEDKLEMLQVGAAHMLTLMENWFRELGEDTDEDLRESLTRWSSTLDTMAQEFEDAKDDQA